MIFRLLNGSDCIKNWILVFALSLMIMRVFNTKYIPSERIPVDSCLESWLIGILLRFFITFSWCNINQGKGNEELGTYFCFLLFIKTESKQRENILHRKKKGIVLFHFSFLSNET